MPYFAILFLFYIGFEIYFLVVIGEILGLFLTLVWVLGTIFLGVFLIKKTMIRQSLNLQNLFSQNGSLNQISSFFSVDAAIKIMIAALLIILPGFITDFFGIIILLLNLNTLKTILILKAHESPVEKKDKNTVIIDVDDYEEK